MQSRSRRRRAQAGTTLVELLVATVLMGLTLTMLVGLFSTGALDSVLSARDVAAQAAREYELDKIGSGPFRSTPYSDCFVSDGMSSPIEVAYKAVCGAASTIRADVAVAQVGNNPNLQQWTIIVNTWPAAVSVGKPVSTYKVKR